MEGNKFKLEGDVIKKEGLAVTPNLKNYEETYKNFKWEDANSEIEWFAEGKINAAYNAVDRHGKGAKKDKIALHWEGPNGETETYTFKQLMEASNRFANVLKKYGVAKGDRVFFFLPRYPQIYFGFLGTLKAGAIAGTLFSAFGPEALLDRLGDSEAKIVVTNMDLKPRIDQIRDKLPALENVIVIDTDSPGEKEVDLAKELKEASPEFECVKTDAEDYAFMLYTSGTTGKPKGVVHCHNAIIQETMTAKWVLDIQDPDVYWCTADPGWVTGIAYGILGIWSAGATSVVYAGRFKPEKWYEIIQKHKVSIWYTAPTAVRLLMKAGNELVQKYDLSSVRHCLSVGEPLNPEAIRWGIDALNLVFHDNWWQTETGAQMIANYACMDIRLGSMGKPIPGVKVAIVDDDGKEVPRGTEGNLAVVPGWPSMMRTIWRNQPRYDKCFKDGWYITGDRASMDEDGYVWFVGRADDVIKTAGERVGPFEVESALVEHPAIAEAGVIGKPDVERGQIIKAFVVLKDGYSENEQLVDEIKKFVKTRLAGHAYPREIEFRDKLPKTRSGKIMRRVLKAQEMGEEVGDVSTLSDE